MLSKTILKQFQTISTLFFHPFNPFYASTNISNAGKMRNASGVRNKTGNAGITSIIFKKLPGSQGYIH